MFSSFSDLHFFVMGLMLIEIISSILYLNCFSWSMVLGIKLQRKKLEKFDISRIPLGKKIKLNNCAFRKVNDTFIIFRTERHSYQHGPPRSGIKLSDGELYLIRYISFIPVIIFPYAVFFIFMVMILSDFSVVMLMGVLFMFVLVALPAWLAREKNRESVTNAIAEIRRYAEDIENPYRKKLTTKENRVQTN